MLIVPRSYSGVRKNRCAKIRVKKVREFLGKRISFIFIGKALLKRKNRQQPTVFKHLTIEKGMLQSAIAQ